MNTFPRALSETDCITLIGMAGAGKTTIGQELATRLGWAQVDTDHLIEAAYGVCLQAVTDAMSKEAFLDVEARIINSIRVQRVVLSTGGSVVYRDEAMQYLSTLGPIVYLDVPLSTILERIALKPDRGIAIAEGQTIEDLFIEREDLYRKWANYSIQTTGLTVEQCVDAILASVKAVPCD